jgi:hypothetical protein
MYLPLCVDFEVLYEGQSSTMESLIHSKKTPTKLVKQTQKVHKIHATNVEN